MVKRFRKSEDAIAKVAPEVQRQLQALRERRIELKRELVSVTHQIDTLIKRIAYVPRGRGTHCQYGHALVPGNLTTQGRCLECNRYRAGEAYRQRREKKNNQPA